MPQPALRSARRLLLACAPLACVPLAWVLTAPLPAAHAQAPGAPPPAVTVSAPVTRQTTDYLEYTGQFAAVDYVEIRSRVSGFLAERHFTDGQIVTKGDLLAVIDPRPFEIELQGAEAQRDTAAAQLDFSQRDVARGAALRQTEALATSTFDQRVQQMKTAGAALSAANAAIRNAKLDLEYSRVTAPISGRIGALQVSAGNLIVGGKDSNNSTLLTTIVSVDPLWFNFDMSESDFLAYSRAVSQGRLGSPRDGGTAAQLRLDDERDWTRAATINFIDNQIDRSLRHHPRPRHRPQPRPLHHPRPVRPHPPPLIRAAHRPPRARRRRHHRPIPQGRHDSGRNRHRRAKDSHNGPHRRRPEGDSHRARPVRPGGHRRPAPRPARHKGHPATGLDHRAKLGAAPLILLRNGAT